MQNPDPNQSPAPSRLHFIPARRAGRNRPLLTELESVFISPLHRGRPAGAADSMRHPRIPTGFRPKAKGCEARATLGHRPQNISNRNAVAAISFCPFAWCWPQPRWGCSRFAMLTQGRRWRANLGLMAAIPLGLNGARRSRRFTVRVSRVSEIIHRSPVFAR